MIVSSKTGLQYWNCEMRCHKVSGELIGKAQGGHDTYQVPFVELHVHRGLQRRQLGEDHFQVQGRDKRHQHKTRRDQRRGSGKWKFATFLYFPIGR